MKRNKKGRFIGDLDKAAYDYIEKELKVTDRGVPVRIAQWIVDTYGVTFLYAYQVVMKHKKRLEMTKNLTE